jgi:hypothetical protein
MKVYGDVAVQLHVLLTQALQEGEWLVLRSVRFISIKEIPLNNWIGYLFGHRPFLNGMPKEESLYHYRESNPTLPTHGQLSIVT